MRAGILVLGPLLAKFGSAKVSLPGGCAIGTRPVDIHLKALSKLGVKYKIRQGYVIAKAPQGLKGNKIHFPKISLLPWLLGSEIIPWSSISSIIRAALL